MNRSSRSAVALLCISSFLGCESRDQAPASKPSAGVKTPVTTEARSAVPRNPKIPPEVSYQVTSDGQGDTERRLVDVNLNTKVSPEVLREIALEVKAREERQHDRTVIFYYLPAEFPEIAGQPWATTQFKPALEVKILGLTKAEEDELRGIKLDHKGTRIGAWLQDNQYKTLDLIYEEGGAIKIAEIRSPTERTDTDMVELPSKSGRLFKKEKGVNVYAIDRAGNLRISNGEGQVFSAASPMR